MQVNLLSRHGVADQSLGYNAAQYSQQKTSQRHANGPKFRSPIRDRKIMTKKKSLLGLLFIGLNDEWLIFNYTRPEHQY